MYYFCSKIKTLVWLQHQISEMACALNSMATYSNAIETSFIDMYAYVYAYAHVYAYVHVYDTHLYMCGPQVHPQTRKHVGGVAQCRLSLSSMCRQRLAAPSG